MKARLGELAAKHGVEFRTELREGTVYVFACEAGGKQFEMLVSVDVTPEWLEHFDHCLASFRSQHPLTPLP